MHKCYPKAAFHQIVSSLAEIYGHEEGKSIAHLVLEKVYGLSPTDILINQSITSAPGQKRIFDDAIKRLQNHEPVQYVLNEAYFFGRKFYVDENVLVPRQETESLIQLIKDSKVGNAPKILDIGCGSGCIAITLSLELEGAHVEACDISKNALAVAKNNSEDLGAAVHFFYLDVLNDPIPDSKMDLIVCNPPYVLNSEKKSMRRNVLDFEPSSALFVPDSDPLLYYRTVMGKFSKILNPGGHLFFEINEHFGEEIANLFQRFGFIKSKIYRDLNDKRRFASATLP